MNQTFTGRRWLLRLPERFRWTIHNLIAHPVGEVLYQMGFERLSDAIHEGTVPWHERGKGRG